MAKFLSTAATNYHLEELIKSARERLTLISPYLKINQRIKELLADCARERLAPQIVYGKRELNLREQQWLLETPRLQTLFCSNLHAKCYLNEKVCIITSLNLHQFSQQNNNEMGVLIDCFEDAQLYADALAEADRIIRISEPTTVDDKGDSESLTEVSTHPEPRLDPDYEKLTISKLALKLGIKSRLLVDKLIGRGWIEVENDRRRLTAEGKSVGGEERFSPRRGSFLVWPADLRI